MMPINREDLLERMYEESGVMRQTSQYSEDRRKEAEERLDRIATLAQEEDIDLPVFLLDACESGLSTEVNSQSAEMLNKPKVSSN